MMLPLQEILNKYDVHPKGCIQVGAHFCEEHEELIRCGIKEMVYIEPCKDAFKVILDKFSLTTETGLASTWGKEPLVHVANIACGDKKAKSVMYVSHQNQGQSNSLLQPELHLQQHQEIIFDDAEMVDVYALDELMMATFNHNDLDLLMMDVQGAEGLVLKGATETLKHIDIIYTEVNRGQTYAGNMEIDEMDKFLEEYGFKRVETHWPSPNWTWGDAVYIKQ